MSTRESMRWGRRASAVLCFLLLALAPLPLRSESASDRLAKLRAEIEDRESRARKFAREADGLIGELEGIDRQVVESRRSQRQLRARKQEAEVELEQARAALADAERKLVASRKDLSSRLVVLYKSRYAGKLPALYAAPNFQSGLRVASGLERVIKSDAVLFARYRKGLDDWRSRSTQARGLVVEVEGTEVEYLKRKQDEKRRLIERRNLVDLLRTRSDRELRAANELRLAAARLEEQLRTAPAAEGRGKPGTLRRGKVRRPIAGKVRQSYGRQVDPEFNTVTRRTGIEIAAERGAPVRAIADGRVIFADWFRGYGQMAIVDHGDGSVSVSGFLEELKIAPSDVVTQGQVIGTVGETGSFAGPGLYFELRQNGQPVDPEAWFE
jgi:septal ring factor EnvC (AmiA/AmiB activator)